MKKINKTLKFTNCFKVKSWSGEIVKGQCVELEKFTEKYYNPENVFLFRDEELNYEIINRYSDDKIYYTIEDAKKISKSEKQKEIDYYKKEIENYKEKLKELEENTNE